MRRTHSVTLFVAFLLSVVAFSAASGARTATPSPAIVKVAFNKKLKTSILVDGRGITLYLYTIDRQRGKPTCYNAPLYLCAKAFPPLRTKGAPRAGQGVKVSLLGVAKRTDGSLQVTYNRHPLYTNAGLRTLGLIADKKPGDVYGQNFEGTFFVVSPKGTPIFRK